jgi:hypothetical protein
MNEKQDNLVPERTALWQNSLQRKREFLPASHHYC